MSNLSVNFRKFLLAQSSLARKVAARIHQDHIPQSSSAPYVYFSRQNAEFLTCLDSEVGEQPHAQSFAIECIGRDIGDAQELGDEIRAINNYKGTFGDTSVQAVFVEDQSDDYEPRVLSGDDGAFSCNLRVTIYPREFTD